MFLILMLKFFLVLSMKTTSTEDCDIDCSNIIEEVCGKVKAWDGTVTISRYHNICHLNRIKCRLKDVADIRQIPDEQCHIKKQESLRRVLDFGIVGAHQACNHSCPTYCVDTYEPVCAQIWNRGMKKYSTRTMVNHCHVDLFSCSVGVNVTITPLGKCFVNPAGLLFMSQMAAMKSLGFLDGSHRRRLHLNMRQLDNASDREDIKSNSNWDLKHLFRRLLNSVVFKRLMTPWSKE